jgi:hypothetical protein
MRRAFLRELKEQAHWVATKFKNRSKFHLSETAKGKNQREPSFGIGEILAKVVPGTAV